MSSLVAACTRRSVRTYSFINAGTYYIYYVRFYDTAIFIRASFMLVTRRTTASASPAPELCSPIPLSPLPVCRSLHIFLFF